MITTAPPPQQHRGDAAHASSVLLGGSGRSVVAQLVLAQAIRIAFGHTDLCTHMATPNCANTNCSHATLRCMVCQTRL